MCPRGLHGWLGNAVPATVQHCERALYHILLSWDKITIPTGSVVSTEYGTLIHHHEAKKIVKSNHSESEIVCG